MAETLLVTGCRGQLGSDLVKYFSDSYSVIGCDVSEFDLTDRDAVCRAVEAARPALVIHAAAFTDVDGCESSEETAMAVNSIGTRNVAEASRELGARLIYYSTDYVFDGTKKAPYTENDRPNPKTVYGRSKLAGEEHVKATLENYAILRLAWVYGYYGKNFVRTMIKLGYEQTRAVQRGEIIQPLKVVDDQTGNPTWTMEIARQTNAVINGRCRGVFHCTAEGETSWYNLARRIFETLGMEIQIRPCSTEQFPRPAPRPAYSSLENLRLKQENVNMMRPWDDALEDFLLTKKEKLLKCNPA